MKTQQLLLLSIATFLAHASPARPDCGITKTFEATNLCGQTYGGQVLFPTYLHCILIPRANRTWEECTSGPTYMPTFFIPSCSVTATPTPTEVAEETQPGEIIDLAISTESAAALITPAPATTACPALIVCVDGMVECGEGQKRFE
jgi:hypothetical protein